MIGVGEPSAHQANGHFFQLSNVFGVEQERGFTLGYDKYNWQEHSHFITEDVEGELDFGEGKEKYLCAGQRAGVDYKRQERAACCQQLWRRARGLYQRSSV